MKARKTLSLAAAAAVMSAICMIPQSASAAGSVYSTVLTTEDELKTTVLDKYLVMDKSAGVPDSSFTIEVRPGTAVPADTEAGTLEVLAGIGSIASLDAELSFSPADTTVNEADKGTDTPVFTTSDTSDEKYVKKTLELDFSDTAFTEPGVYRYIITETGNNQGITNGYVSSTETETVRTLDVYVEDAGTIASSGTIKGKPELKIAGYVMYNGLHTAAPKADTEAETDTKNSTITNVFTSGDLTFGKIVTGNQGSRDKYFRYELTISGIGAEGTALAADLSLADTTVPASPNAATDSSYAGKTNPAQLIADTSKTIAADGYKAEAVTEDDVTTYTITAEYYLQHGQYITIKGIPEGCSYALTETTEDYLSTDGIAEDLSTLDWDGASGNDALADALTGTVDGSDIHTGFTNDRSGSVPTGILSTFGASAALAAVGIAGIAGGMICLRKKKSEED